MVESWREEGEASTIGDKAVPDRQQGSGLAWSQAPLLPLSAPSALAASTSAPKIFRLTTDTAEWWVR